VASTTWSTDTVGTREGFTFWQDAVCRAVLNVSTEAPSEGFRARIASRSFDTLRFACFAATGHEIVRSRTHIAGAGEDHYLVSLQTHGRSRIAQGERAFLLEPGEIAVLDGQQPFRVAFPERVRRVLAVIPRRAVDSRTPRLRTSPTRRIAAEGPYADLLRRHLLQLAQGEGSLGPAEAALLTENLCNLLVLATAEDPAAEERHPQVQVEAMLAFCRRHLSDPDLSPRTVAAHCRVSVRTVHLRFEATGRTFGRWLLDSRLDACQRALRDPQQAGRGISEIAYAAGFGDLSHFNRAFRQRSGMTPSDWRGGGGGVTAPMDSCFDNLSMRTIHSSSS